MYSCEECLHYKDCIGGKGVLFFDCTKLNNRKEVRSLNDLEFKLLKFRMEQAFMEAEKSPCLKKKVGAVLLNNVNFDLLSKGYGGAQVPCDTCKRKEFEWQQDGCWSVHSEMRAIFNYFSKYGYVIQGGLPNTMLLTTHGPCDQCIKYSVYFGIPIITYSVYYHNDYSKWKGKIKIYQLTDTEWIEQI